MSRMLLRKCRRTAPRTDHSAIVSLTLECRYPSSVLLGPSEGLRHRQGFFSVNDAFRTSFEQTEPRLNSGKHSLLDNPRFKNLVHFQCSPEQRKCTARSGKLV